MRVRESAYFPNFLRSLHHRHLQYLSMLEGLSVCLRAHSFRLLPMLLSQIQALSESHARKKALQGTSHPVPLPPLILPSLPPSCPDTHRADPSAATGCIYPISHSNKQCKFCSKHTDGQPWQPRAHAFNTYFADPAQPCYMPLTRTVFNTVASDAFSCAPQPDAFRALSVSVPSFERTEIFNNVQPPTCTKLERNFGSHGL